MEKVTSSSMLSPGLNIARRFAVLVTGYSFAKGSVFLFDHLLYGAVSSYFNYTFGAAWGSTMTLIVMAPLSALICLCMIKGYDFLKIDWLGLEAVKEFKEEIEEKGPIKRLMRYLLRKGDWVAFVTLSVVADPFFTTVYMRRGKYNGLSTRDKKIFWGSVIFSNAYWTIRWTVLIELVVLLFGLIPEGWRTWILETVTKIIEFF